MKIMFVCTGNTCRSPMAHAFMLDMLAKYNVDDVEVDSAGLYCEEGAPISEYSKKALEHYDIEFSHESKPLTKEDIDTFDYIICMTASHKRALEDIVPKEKLFTMDDFTKKGDISDPYGQSLEVYLKTAEQIKSAISEIISKILSK